MLNRRSFLKASTAASVLPAPMLVRAQDKKVLRYVPNGNLTVLDPIFTPAAVTVTHGYAVFDTLFGVNSKLEAQPQMAEGATVSENQREWKIKLREGLMFHDGEPVPDFFLVILCQS